MRAVEELVRRKLENRAPDELSPNVTLTNAAHHGALVSYSLQQSQTEGRQSKLCCHNIQQASNFNGD